MPDYSKWIRSTASVVKLQLDPLNPRIPSSGRVLGQRELIEELVYHENVLDLAKSIASQGFFPTDALVVVEEDNTRYVVEGNRRLAALKLLLSPESAPQDRVRQFRALADTLPSTAHITRIQVTIAPSRDAAIPLIIDRHTQSQVERWCPIMQTRFYRTLLQRGHKREDLCATFGIRPADLGEALRNDALYSMACSVELPPELRQVVHNPRVFPMSSLERILEYKDVQSFLGIHFDDTADVRINVALDDFRRAYARIVKDVADGTITSRKHNSVKEVREYLKSLADAAPNPAKYGDYTAADVARNSSQPEPPSQIIRPSIRKPRQTRSVIPAGIKCRLAEPRIDALFAELKSLPVAKYPNATALMLRTLLEMCVSHFIDKTQRTNEMLVPYKKKGKPPEWYPSLRQQLDFLLTLGEAAFPVTPLGRKALRKLLSAKDSVTSLEYLDGFVHNRYVQPDQKDLRAFWHAIAPTMDVVLVEPATSCAS